MTGKGRCCKKSTKLEKGGSVGEKGGCKKTVGVVLSAGQGQDDNLTDVEEIKI